MLKAGRGEQPPNGPTPYRFGSMMLEFEVSFLA